MFNGSTRVKISGDKAIEFRRFDKLPPKFRISNLTGEHDAELIVREGHAEPAMIYLGKGSLATPETLIKSGANWIPARDGLRMHPRMQFKGALYDLRVLSEKPDDQHFILSDKLVIRCAKP